MSDWSPMVWDGRMPGAAEFRILGLDVGHRRIGVALGNSALGTADPLPPISGRQRGRVFEVLAERCAQYGIAAIIVGLPYTLSGEVGPQAESVLKFVDALRQRTTLPVRTWDESYSTADAREVLRARGIPPARWPDLIDSLAAAIMLESYLAARPSTAPRREGAGDSEVTA